MQDKEQRISTRADSVSINKRVFQLERVYPFLSSPSYPPYILRRIRHERPERGEDRPQRYEGCYIRGRPVRAACRTVDAHIGYVRGHHHSGANVRRDPRARALVRPCGKCLKAPPKGSPAFAKCGQCATTGYCSRECQAAHWKEHKPVCKQRVAQAARLAEQREAARLAGTRFCTPVTLQTWYRNNSAAIEYAAFHALELHKGPRASLRATHLAVFTVKVDETEPEDAARVRLVDFGAAPFAEFAQMVHMSETNAAMCRRAVRSGQMALYFMDMEEALHVLEFHVPPSSGPYASGKSPHPHWRLNVLVKLNGGLSTDE
ncbi:hypothetical protein FB451DRAFT_598744 [Mycena latifolia]|nr:hypothetical protein FB451DRAFT_598744 [Mycena latifolia]